MKPRLLNLTAGVSLLLAIVIVVLWVRSYGHRDTIDRFWQTPAERNVWRLESWDSYLSLGFAWRPHLGHSVAPSYKHRDWTQLNAEDLDTGLSFPLRPVGFHHHPPSLFSYGVRSFSITYWLLLPLTLVTPAIAFERHRRRRRRETNNLCPTCGYDLRATPDRCPECGLRQAQSSGAVAEMQKSEC